MVNTQVVAKLKEVVMLFLKRKKIRETNQKLDKKCKGLKSLKCYRNKARKILRCKV